MANIKYAGEAAVGRIADYVNAKLTFVSSMPASPTTNTIVLYVGATTGSYTQGGVYKFDGTNWNLINLVKTIELTQDEYEALPVGVQNNGTIYFITDAYFPGSVAYGYFNELDGKFYKEHSYTTEIKGGKDVLYVSMDNNVVYSYDINYKVYIPIISLTLGETASTAYRGDRGKTAYDHSQIVNDNPHNTTLSLLSDIDATLPPDINNVLLYNGTKWIPSVPILPINPSVTPTEPGSIWIETS